MGAILSHDPITDKRDGVRNIPTLGPTSDGRLKPDLVAPGDTQSAFATSIHEQLLRLEKEERRRATHVHCTVFKELVWQPRMLQLSACSSPATSRSPPSGRLRAEAIAVVPTVRAREELFSLRCIVEEPSCAQRESSDVIFLPSYNAYTKVPSFSLQEPLERNVRLSLICIRLRTHTFAVLPRLSKSIHSLYIWDHLVLFPGAPSL